MAIQFDRQSWTTEPAGRAGDKSGAPEWHGLVARLYAARGASRELAVEPLPVAGSFDGVSARVLADYDQTLSVVNPVFWVDGKPARTMDATVADTNPGDRG